MDKIRPLEQVALMLTVVVLMCLGVVAVVEVSGCGKSKDSSHSVHKATVKKASGVITLDDPVTDPATDVEISDAARSLDCSPIGITRGNYKVTVYCSLRRV